MNCKQLKTQEGKKLIISEKIYDLDGNPIPFKSLTEGKVLLNVWASWCITCLVEHPFLKSITESKDVKLIGINYKDQSFNALNYLDKNGDLKNFQFSIYLGYFPKTWSNRSSRNFFGDRR